MSEALKALLQKVTNVVFLLAILAAFAGLPLLSGGLFLVGLLLGI